MKKLKVANLDLMESDWPSRPTIPQYTCLFIQKMENKVVLN